jgi:glucose-1-phosphate thymidylyltransferase
MDAIVLAGGYATRLYPITKNFPKQLLPVGGVPIINYLLEKLNKVPSIDRIVISTNEKFKEHFSKWMERQNQSKPMVLHVEKSTSEKEKLGAIAALGGIFEIYNGAKDFLIVAGDNLFEDSLKDFVSFFYEMKRKTGNVIAGFDTDVCITAVALVRQERRHIKKSLASVKLDPKSARITKFIEKSPNEQTDLIGTGIYALSNDCLKKIKANYLSEKNNSFDSPGYFMEWLSKRDDVELYGYVFSQRWWDIGTMESYVDAAKYFKKG